MALRRGLGGELSDRHVALVRLFIEGGLAVMAVGLLPPLLDLMGLAESLVWRLSSTAAGLTFTIYIVTQFRRRRRVESGRPPLRVSINFTISIIAVVGLWLKATGILFEPNLAPMPLPLPRAYSGLD